MALVVPVVTGCGGNSGTGNNAPGNQRSIAQQRQQSQGEITVTSNFQNRFSTVPLGDIPWKFQPGDNPQWASPGFDDSAWQLRVPALSPPNILKKNWPGVGWFRLHLLISPDTPFKSMGITGYPPDNIQIYWDGHLVSEELTGSPVSLPIAGKERHLLAVRYAVPDIEKTRSQGKKESKRVGFSAKLGEFIPMMEWLKWQRSEQMFFTALPLAFMIVHLLLFLYSPPAKSNLYYALFLLLWAVHFYVDIQHSFLSNQLDEILFLNIFERVLLALMAIAALRFVYALFYRECPKQFRFISLFFVIIGAVFAVKPGLGHLRTLLLLVWFIETFRVMVDALLKKKNGAGIVGSGLIVFFVFASYDFLLDIGAIRAVNYIQNAYQYGAAGLFIAMSAFLAREVAITSRDRILQERRAGEAELARKLVEADNQRKTNELEGARKLQLSMLPPCVADAIPGCAICFHMTTAAEVGGDYYDYLLEKDGTLSLVVGDATGHGMKAGIMVASIKSLFLSMGTEEDAGAFFARCSATIRQMNMRHLFMGLTLIRLKGNRLQVTSAGMPPLLIFRAEGEGVEERIIKSPPLGGFRGFNYVTKETELKPGDTILQISDGLPELFNQKGEMMGYSRVKELLKEAGHRSPDRLIGHLTAAADKWRGEKAQDDDITLVALKYQGVSGEASTRFPR